MQTRIHQGISTFGMEIPFLFLLASNFMESNNGHSKASRLHRFVACGLLDMPILDTYRYVSAFQALRNMEGDHFNLSAAAPLFD